jgi:hypothetical protein
MRGGAARAERGGAMPRDLGAGEVPAAGPDAAGPLTRSPAMTLKEDA